MNVLEQFKTDFLDSLESENKDKIISAFGEVTSVFNETISRRDSVSNTNRDLKEKIDGISKALELGEDFTADDITKLLNEKQGDTVKIKEQISAQYEEKYSGDMKALNEELQGLKSQNGEITTKYNDTLFLNAVVNSGLLDGFVDDKDARDNIIIPKIKDKLLYKDGQVFVKDGITGDIANRIGTNEPLNPSSVVDSVKTTISPIYLKAQANGNGMGTTTTQQHSADTTVDASKHKSVGSFMNEAMSGLNK